MSLLLPARLLYKCEAPDARCDETQEAVDPAKDAAKANPEVLTSAQQTTEARIAKLLSGLGAEAGARVTELQRRGVTENTDKLTSIEQAAETADKKFSEFTQKFDQLTSTLDDSHAGELNQDQINQLTAFTVGNLNGITDSEAGKIYRSQIVDKIEDHLAKQAKISPDSASQILVGTMAREKFPNDTVDQTLFKAMRMVDGGATLGTPDKRKAIAEKMNNGEDNVKIDAGMIKLGDQTLGIKNLQILVGGGMATIDAKLTNQFILKDAVKADDGRVWARMQNGCESNLVIIDTFPPKMDGETGIQGGTTLMDGFKQAGSEYALGAVEEPDRKYLSGKQLNALRAEYKELAGVPGDTIHGAIVDEYWSKDEYGGTRWKGDVNTLLSNPTFKQALLNRIKTRQPSGGQTPTEGVTSGSGPIAPSGDRAGPPGFQEAMKDLREERARQLSGTPRTIPSLMADLMGKFQTWRAGGDKREPPDQIMSA